MNIFANESLLELRRGSVRQEALQALKALDAKLDEQLREGRREIDAIIEGLKAKTAELTQQAARRSAAALNTGEAGSVRADARAALELPGTFGKQELSDTLSFLVLTFQGPSRYCATDP